MSAAKPTNAGKLLGVGVGPGDPELMTLKAMRALAEADVIAHFASGEAIVRYEPAPPMTGTTGDIEALSMWAGQGVALARLTQPAADIVAELTSRL